MFRPLGPETNVRRQVDRVGNQTERGVDQREGEDEYLAPVDVAIVAAAYRRNQTLASSDDVSHNATENGAGRTQSRVTPYDMKAPS